MIKSLDFLQSKDITYLFPDESEHSNGYLGSIKLFIEEHK